MTDDFRRWLAEAIRRDFDRLFDQAAFSAYTTTSTTESPPPLTYDGLLYQLAVFQQDLEEDPIATAFRAEPGTLARFLYELRHHIPVRSASIFAPTGPGYFDGIRLEEDNELPPRPPGWVDVLDHKRRVMKRIVI